MVKFILLVISLVNTSLLEDRIVEMQPLQWKEYEQTAYAVDLMQFLPPFLVNRPFNKPTIKHPYYEMSEYSRNWLRKRQTIEEAYRLTVPQYYMTPFITKDMIE